MKIWVKVIEEEKITIDYLHKNDLVLNKKNYEKSIRDICNIIDVDCPILFDVHYNHFTNFNCAKYLNSEFCIPQSFDYMLVENIIEKI